MRESKRQDGRVEGWKGGRDNDFTSIPPSSHLPTLTHSVIYTILLTYLVIVVYPMIWLLYT